MRLFTEMYLRIDRTTSTNQKVQALADYLNVAPQNDRLWAIALFTHKRPRRTVSTTLLRSWAAELAELPLWLFEESYHIVGDLAETIALVLPPPTDQIDKSLTQYIHDINVLKDRSEKEKKEFILGSWSQLDRDQRFIFNKLITGGFRIGVSQKSVVKALSALTDIDENAIAHRLMGSWHPDDITFEDLILNPKAEDNLSKPYPFYLAYSLEKSPDSLGDIEEWQAEWKWDGVRGQLIKRQGKVFLWSRGEELVTDQFPEFDKILLSQLDGFVIDGEIVVMKNGQIQSFNQLQKRIGRKKVAKKHLDEAPVSMIAYDLLEYNNQDIRIRSMKDRRDLLKEVIADLNQPNLLSISPIIEATTWQELTDIRKLSRERDAEGLMLKHKNAVYRSGRKKGDWWKWKVDPMTIDAVMIYAQRGHGRRANLYTDFTFGVWDRDQLIPFAKAYSGLTDVEFKKVTQFVKKNTEERFGPVSRVKPELVFELAFEGIAESKRHKSGVALRFPRIKRWRLDKPATEANTLTDLKSFL